MNPIRYSIGNTRNRNTMPLSIGHHVQVHASGPGAAPPSNVTISQSRSISRFVMSRIFGRVN